MFTVKKNRAKICHCSLNQSAMDFENNKRRIIESIKFAKAEKCVFRVGAELEVPGYSCDDHFKEVDLYYHCWETVGDILAQGLSNDIVIDLGMPVLHRSVSYNCKVILYNGKIILIRPKMHLADEGNYREKRFFMNYIPQKDFELEKYYLPDYIKKLTGQDFSPFGYANLRFQDMLVGLEICEEVWRLNSISRNSYLECDVIICSNGSHFQKGKIATRHNLIKEIIQKSSVAYIYTNAIGFDGAAMYFDGQNLAMTSAGILQMGEPCSMREVVCDAVVIDLFSLREDKLGDISHMEEASRNNKVPDIFIDKKFADCEEEATTPIQNIEFDSHEKQMMLAASSYLWDYIRKTGAAGVFLPLSGGADSGLTALMVYYMCERLYNYCHSGANDVLTNLRKVVGQPDYTPSSPKEICNKIFSTSYMGSKQSSAETRKRAKELAEFINSDHSEIDIEEAAQEIQKAIKKVFDVTLKFQCEGGSWGEDIALQNIYARIRMIFSYLLAQLVPIRRKNNGFFLVLAAGNLDETLTGYFTKYDCSSADLNLLGTMSKIDIKKTLHFLHKHYHQSVISDIENAKATADLRPSTVEQNDEDEIGLTFKEIDVFANVRTERNCSVVSFYKVAKGLLPDIADEVLYDKIKNFFQRYARNRHKTEVLTTTLHLTSKSCSSKRFDLRPIVYEDCFKYELKKLDDLIKKKE
jgi:NAD+ synthase (glutamine-hydrolysing)